MQTIHLDISKKGIVPPINAKQNDAGRKFKVFLLDGGVPYNAYEKEANFSLWYAGESGDGNYDTVAEESAFYVEGNSVIVELSPQMLKNPGSGQMCLTMSDIDNHTIGLWNIPYEVEAMPGYPSDQEKPYYPRIVRTVNGIQPDVNGNVAIEAGGLDLENLTMDVIGVDGGNRLSLSDGTTTKTALIPAVSADADDIQTAVDRYLAEHPVENGKDGVSPTVTVTAITGGHRVTITDATGTKTFDVMDGEDGQGASITVDGALSTTSTNPIQNKAVAQRLSELTEAFSESLENVAEMIPGLDDTLSETGKAADAKAVGDAITQATQDVGQILEQVMGSIPTDAHINDLIDAYLSEALGGDY